MFRSRLSCPLHALRRKRPRSPSLLGLKQCSAHSFHAPSTHCAGSGVLCRSRQWRRWGGSCRMAAASSCSLTCWRWAGMGVGAEGTSCRGLLCWLVGCVAQASSRVSLQWDVLEVGSALVGCQCCPWPSWVPHAAPLTQSQLHSWPSCAVCCRP